MPAASTLLRPALRIARLPRLPIYHRLCIEEALFYKTSDNWFVYSEGPPSDPPTVVLGISGKPERMCNLELVQQDGIPLVRRFSGGGTVIVDSDTIFTSLIVNQTDVPHVQPYPREVMEWSKGIFGPALAALAPPSGGSAVQLGLRENDYVFGDLKFGGNAQAISKGRWLHHTSFLWAYSPEVMRYLTLPEKRPAYRRDRPHASFLTPLHRHIAQRDDFCPAVVEALASQFEVREAPHAEIEDIIDALGGAAAWAAACRTKFVGPDGKALPDAAAAAAAAAVAEAVAQ
ncbi:Biotin/lipoate A/B protein ligase family [Tribonema minus]|uniref:Biotin/lipoate A/B protein ligase family n=1 Tax=Tribonema minus TaxID=303371 RepID=A0A836CA98_9STRA|nr:Biotin/lipoate A/B protein ligase family [Tribonema minus]